LGGKCNGISLRSNERHIFVGKNWEKKFWETPNNTDVKKVENRQDKGRRIHLPYNVLEIKIYTGASPENSLD